ncbi:unnamed protein product [Rotaria sp. Silwood2]|nr:unnamed protein product [Rotaria sp. Silwood2]CAF4456004.1 unnamed protein product [Rotaria sp. Silwood2]
MSHLEELTLYLRIFNRPIFIDGTHLHNEILIHMPRLHIFKFYITTENKIDDSIVHLSNDDIQRTFENLEHRQMTCFIDYFNNYKAICRIFSLPFQFDRLEDITNHFPNIIFNYATPLKVYDKIPFKHEFFVRVARSFPLLQCFSVENLLPPFWIFNKPLRINDEWYSVVEYPHLISLDISYSNIYYIEQFLNEAYTYLPCLTELKFSYNSLEFVTDNFARGTTRRNCAKVKRLIAGNSIIIYSEKVYRYFPSM